MAFQDLLLLEGINVGMFTPTNIYLDVRKAAVIELKNNNNELIGLTSGNNTIVKQDDIIELNKTDTILEAPDNSRPTTKLKVCSIKKLDNNKIKELNNYSYELVLFPQTMSNMFVLPLLSFKHISEVNLACFINTYLGFDKEPDCKKIYLLYRYNYHLGEFEQTLTKTNGFSTQYDVNPDYVVYEFIIEEKYQKDVQMFIKGKYSKMSDEAKRKILSFFGFSKNGNMYGVLYKTPAKRKDLESFLSVHLPDTAELFSICELQKEILKTETLNELS